MKRNACIIFFLPVFVTALILPIACKKETELVDRNFAHKVGKILLPPQSRLNTDDFVILTEYGEFSVSNGEFKIEGVEDDVLSFFVAKSKNSDLSLLGFRFGEEGKIEISAQSTALSLFMIMPLFSIFDRPTREIIISKIKSHPKFNLLVNLLEEQISNNLDYLLEGSGILEIIDEIISSQYQSYRISNALNSNSNETVVFKVENEQLVIENRSFIPYYVKLYDESTGNSTQKWLGYSELVNAGLDDMAIGLWEDISVMLSGCEDIISGNSELKCGSRWMEVVRPMPIRETFAKEGAYRIEVCNARYFLENPDNPLAAEAMKGLVVRYFIGNIGSISGKMRKKLQLKFIEENFVDGRVKCKGREVADLLEELMKMLDVKFDEKPTAEEILLKLTKAFYDLSIDTITDCFISQVADFSELSKGKKFWAVIFQKLKKLNRIQDTNNKIGVLLNTFGVGYCLISDQPYYKKCYTLSNGEVKDLCEEDDSLPKPSGSVDITVSYSTNSNLLYPNNWIERYNTFFFDINLEDDYKPNVNGYIYLISSEQNAYGKLQIDRTTIDPKKWNGGFEYRFYRDNSSGYSSNTSTAPDLTSIDHMLEPEYDDIYGKGNLNFNIVVDKFLLLFYKGDSPNSSDRYIISDIYTLPKRLNSEDFNITFPKENSVSETITIQLE